MNYEKIDVIKEDRIYTGKRLCWSAILAGALVAIGLGFLLNVFAMAIGLGALAVNNTGSMALTWGGLAGLVVGTIASMLTAGYVAGYLGRYYAGQRNLGIIYGFCTWSLALILSGILASHVTGYVGYTGHKVAHSGLISKANIDESTPAVLSGQTHAAARHTPNQVATNGNQPAQIAPSAGDFALSAFIAFILFFIGAVSTCLGAAWGMNSERED